MPGFVHFRSYLLVAVLALPLAGGCSMHWTEGWKLDRDPAMKGTPDPVALRQVALAAEGSVSNRASVDSLVRAWRDVLRVLPEDYEAMWHLSSAYTLLGAGYARSIGEKGQMYRRALQNAERAMALDEAFRGKIEEGASTSAAIAVLPANRADAVGWWATAMVLMFEECLSGVVQETNRSWIVVGAAVGDHLQVLAPAWNDGLATYQKAVLAAVMPRRAGGDLARATELFGEVIAASPDSLRNRWGRARYLAPRLGDKDMFREDLKWIVGAKPAAAPGLDGWNALYQIQAADMLAHESSWF